MRVRTHWAFDLAAAVSSIDKSSVSELRAKVVDGRIRWTLTRPTVVIRRKKAIATDATEVIAGDESVGSAGWMTAKEAKQAVRDILKRTRKVPSEHYDPAFCSIFNAALDAAEAMIDAEPTWGMYHVVK